MIPVGRLIVELAPRLTGVEPGTPPVEAFLPVLLGGRFVAAQLFGAQTGILGFLGLFVFLLLLRIALRRGWLAVTVFCMILMAIFTEAFTAHPVEEIGAWVGAIGATTLLTVTMVRFGLLSLMSMSLTASLLVGFPLTFDLGAWYATIGLVGVLCALGLAAYGFWIALAGQPLFRDQLGA
jgi:hypothetical protein